MGRPLTVSRVGRFTKRMNFIEELRSALPVSQYLTMLHEAAVSGRIPKFDPRSHARLPDAQQDAEPITEQDRAKLLQYLVDKAMPTYSHMQAPEAAGAIDVSEFTDATDADFNALTTDQLRAIAAAATKLAVAGDERGDPTQLPAPAESGAQLAAPVHPVGSPPL